MKPSEHGRLISVAAKSALAPIGCVQKGRSRIWLDDHGWWIGVVEFQPSSWSKGSYLNVGACWLWYEKDFLSFDDGGRVESFREFRNPEQFANTAKVLAERAKEEVLNLRLKFRTVLDAASHLRSKGDNSVWGNYHAGVAAGLNGNVEHAEARFRAIAREQPEFPWIQALIERAATLATLVHDTELFRSEIASVVGKARGLLKLPEIQPGVRFWP